VRRVSPLCAAFQAGCDGVCAAAVQKPTLRRRAGNAEKCGYNTPTQRREAPPRREKSSRSGGASIAFG